MSDDEHNEARELLGALMHDEPPVRIDAKELVRKGRRHTVVVRSATIGSVTLAVVGVVFLAMSVLPGPGGGDTPDIPFAEPPPSTTRACPSEACLVPPFTEDHRSRALTKALQESKDQFIPAGQTAQVRPGSWPGVSNEALKVVKPTNVTLIRPQWPYYASAGVGNDKDGFGTLDVYVNDKGTDGRCASPSSPPLSVVTLVGCEDETLSDGTLAAVSRYVGRNQGTITGHEGYRELRVDAARPDGTRIHVVTTNRAPISAEIQPTRAEPPLGKDDVLAIVELPGVKY